MLRHLAVRLDRVRGLSLLQLLENVFIHKHGHDDIDLGVVLARLGNDTLHAAQGIVVGLIGVLVIIDGELAKQHVQGPLAEHIPLHTESAGVRAGRADASSGEVELGIWEALLEHLTHHRPVAVHLSDGATNEGNVATLVLLKLNAAVLVVTTQDEVLVTDDLLRGRSPDPCPD